MADPVNASHAIGKMSERFGTIVSKGIQYLKRFSGIEKPKSWEEAVQWSFGDKEPDLLYIAKAFDEFKSKPPEHWTAKYRIHMIGVEMSLRRAVAFGVGK